MSNYIYLPVNSIEMWNFAENSREFLEVPVTNVLANKVTSGVGKAMYRWINKCVQNVGANDCLYIILHGAGTADSRFVGGSRNKGKKKQVMEYERGLPKYTGGDMKKYTPDHLAKTLVKEGLSKLVADIHVLTCGSGLADKKDAWAKRLKTALEGHCNNLTVTGYRGNISISSRHAGIVQIQVETEFFPMAGNR